MNINNLNIEFYKFFYKDLKNLTDEQIVKYWDETGKYSRIICNEVFLDLYIEKNYSAQEINKIKLLYNLKDKYELKYKFIYNRFEINKILYPKITELIKYPDDSRIDYDYYIATNKDIKNIQNINIEIAKNHWLKYGQYEGRMYKLLDVDYNIIKNYIKDFTNNSYTASIFFILIINLYNETNHLRIKEYLLTLQSNLKNPHITQIIIYYDTSKDDDNNYIYNFIIDQININNNIKLILCTERPSFKELFEIANNNNNNNNNNNYIISNADIIHTCDLEKLNTINLDNKLIALTRWEFIEETKIVPMNMYNYVHTWSQDTWIFNKTINLHINQIQELNNIYIGTVRCDSKINYYLKLTNIDIKNYCIDIRTVHMHLQGCRKQDYTIESIDYYNNSPLQVSYLLDK